MNEREFADYVRKKFVSSEYIKNWYETKLRGTKLEDTIHTIVFGIHQDQGLTYEDAVTLALFIGLTTQTDLLKGIKDKDVIE